MKGPSPEEQKALLLSQTDPALLEKGGRITLSLFGFFLKEVPILISNESLSPWQGAVLWDYSTNCENGFPVIQIRKNLCAEKQGEILAHELVHAARFSLKEPFFEEILAYQTANQRWRRFFGPLFLSPKEPFIWLATMVIGLVGGAFFSSSLCFFLPYIFLGGVLLRLFILQGIFSLAQNQLNQSGKRAEALSILCQMKDKEIIKMAFSFFSSRQKTRE